MKAPELDQLIDDLLDNAISSENFARLEALLETDAVARMQRHGIPTTTASICTLLWKRWLTKPASPNSLPKNALNGYGQLESPLC